MSELELPEEYPNRNSIKCALHDLHFNPAQSDGCVLCQREEKQRQASAKLRYALGGLALSLLFVLALHGAWKNWSSSAAAPVPSTNRAAYDQDLALSVKSRGKINPEPYRETILQIEDVLYMQSPPADADVAKAAAAGRKLSQQMRQREDRLAAAQAVLHLLTWSQNLDPEAGYAAPDLEPGRRSWEELRQSIFQSADWFKTSGDAAAAAQTPSPPKIDRGVVTELQNVGNDINHLIRTAQMELLAVGEVTGDNDSDPQAVETRRRWERWSRGWEPRVRRVAAQLPNPPTHANNLNLVMAYQKMMTALQKLSTVTVAANDTGVPFVHERNTRLDSARRDLEEAESFLAKLTGR